MKFQKTIMAVLLSGAILFSWGANGGAMFKSLILPGMGQMSGGGGHVYAGLGFMIAEVVSVHAALNSMANANANQKATVLYNREYDVANSYDKKIEIRKKLNDAYDNTLSSKKNMMMWGAVAGGVWIVNVFEALLFVPENNDELSLKTKKYIPVISLQKSGKSVGLQVAKGF